MHWYNVANGTEHQQSKTDLDSRKKTLVSTFNISIRFLLYIYVAISACWRKLSKNGFSIQMYLSTVLNYFGKIVTTIASNCAMWFACLCKFIINPKFYPSLLLYWQHGLANYYWKYLKIQKYLQGELT